MSKDALMELWSMDHIFVNYRLYSPYFVLKFSIFDCCCHHVFLRGALDYVTDQRKFTFQTIHL